MTLGQIFEGANRKTVWSKRGDNVSKRVVSSATDVRPRTKIDAVKEPNK